VRLRIAQILFFCRGSRAGGNTSIFQGAGLLLPDVVTFPRTPLGYFRIGNWCLVVAKSDVVGGGYWQVKSAIKEFF
jgi:hypothetical protein